MYSRRGAQDAKNPTRPIKEGIDFGFWDQINFKFVLDLSGKSSIRIRITQLLSFSRRHVQSRNLLLESTEGRIYELKQPRDLELCRDAAIPSWLLERVKDGDELYFITALQTFTDTALVNTAELERILSIGVKAPVRAVAVLVGRAPSAAVLLYRR
jgi:hypothetical protein